MKRRIRLVIITMALLLGKLTFAQSDYAIVRNVSIIDNHEYYELMHMERILSDSICFTYMGPDESISVYLDGSLRYFGVPHYDPVTEVKDLLFCADRNFKKDSLMLNVYYHKYKLVSKHCLPNNYNTILIDNGLMPLYDIPSVLLYMYYERKKIY